MTNSGTIRIDNGDFELDSNGGSPRYYNYGDIVIGGTGKFHSDADLATDNKFYNYGLIDTYDFLMDGNTALHLYNYCLINTSHDFTLQALGNSNAGIYGSTSLDSIGRINVGGVSNWISGVFTMPNQHQDFCDAGMPVGGWDSRCCVYGGIVTHCNRNSRCALPSIFSVRIQSSDNGVCPGSDVTLTAKITATYPSDAYTYIWSHNPTINAPSITVNPHVATTYSVTVIDNAHGYQATNSIAITVDVDGCVPTLICDGKISININSPTCGSNGTLNLIQNVKLNESPSICSVIWKDLNDSILGSSSTLSGVVAGKYIVEIDCGNITCKEIIPVKESSSTGGLMGTYYTKGECNFSGASIVTQRTDRTINFNWAQQPDVTLGTNVTSARWTGFVLPECSGEYTFYRESNASGKLYVNNILLVDGTGNGTIHLQGGEKYPVVYEVNNYTQNTNAKLEWKTPCKASVKEVIPSCFLEPHHLKGIIPSSDDVCPPSPCETPVINLPSSYDICKEGQSVQLKANALGTFLWSPTGATTSSINISKEGTYTVTVTNWCGKSATAQTHVGIIKDSDVGIVNPYIEACAGESVPLKATGGTCKWYPSDYLNNSTIPNPIATPPISMDYNVEIKTKGGCIVTKQVSIEMKSSFDLKVNNNTVGCLGSKITLHVEGADSYTWSPTDGLLCTNSQCSDPEYIIIGDQKVFTVTGHKDGCTKQATVIVKTGLPSENIDFTVSKTSNCELVFTANNTGFSSYSWDFGDGQIGNGRTITHRYNGHQRYQVCLEVEDKACSGVSRKCKSILVTSEDCSCIPCCHPPCSVTNK